MADGRITTDAFLSSIAAAWGKPNIPTTAVRPCTVGTTLLLTCRPRREGRVAPKYQDTTVVTDRCCEPLALKPDFLVESPGAREGLWWGNQVEASVLVYLSAKREAPGETSSESQSSRGTFISELLSLEVVVYWEAKCTTGLALSRRREKCWSFECLYGGTRKSMPHTSSRMASMACLCRTARRPGQKIELSEVLSYHDEGSYR